MPLGGARSRASASSTGRHSQPVPVSRPGDQIWPQKKIRAQSRPIDVVVKRPGWNAWLAGKTQHLHLDADHPARRLRATT